jgi:type IV secretory pathway TrbF-like protein
MWKLSFVSAHNGVGTVKQSRANDQSGGPLFGEGDKARPNAIVENARREFTSAFSDLARGKRNWQIIAFTLAAVALLEAISGVRLATAAHAIPYLVEVDRLGSITPIGSAEQLRDPDSRLIASQLAQFVRSVRTVLPAEASTAQADLLRRGYAFAGPAAGGFLNAYFSDPAHDPRLLGARVARDVQVTSALKVPDATNAHRGNENARAQTWRLQWVETDRPVGPVDIADSAAVAAWEGYITLDIVPPRNVESIQDNPLGLRVSSITWTRLDGRAVPRDSISTHTRASHDGGIQ